MRRTLWLLALAFTGCVKYHPRPIDAPRLEHAYRARTLADAGVREPLDIGRAADAALRLNPELEVARTRLRSAQAAVLTARGRPNPSLSFGGGATNSPEAHNVRSFEPVFTIETAGKRGLRILEAGRAAEAVRLEVAETEWKVRGRARAAWTDYAFARRAADGWREETALRAEYFAMLEKRLALGEASRPDVDTARGDLLSAEAAGRAAEGQAAGRLPELASAMGLPAAALQAARFADPPQPPPAAQLGLERVQQAGLLHRADVRRALAEYAALEAGLQLEVARQYPDIQLTPGYGFDEGHYRFTFGPSFALPVLNRNQGPIAEAESRRGEAEARFTALQARAIGEMETALTRYRAALVEREDAGRSLALQQARETATRRVFEAGEEDRLTLTGARIQTALARRAQLEAWRKAEAALGSLEDALQHPAEVKP